MIGVYKIMNIKNGKYYVGSSIDIEKRFGRHMRELVANEHHNIYLQRAWNKYGENSFEFSIIKECCSEGEARKLEQSYLDNHIKELYNISLASSGGDLISNNPNRDAIIAKMSKSLKIRYSNLSCEERKKIYGKRGESNGMYGRGHTQETRDKISKILRDKHLKGYRRGKTFEELFGEDKAREMRENLSKAASSRVGEKNHFYGKTHSGETRARISEAMKGNLPTNARKVEIDGVVYPSATEAARQLGVCCATILHRIKSSNKKYVSYKYLT